MLLPSDPRLLSILAVYGGLTALLAFLLRDGNKAALFVLLGLCLAPYLPAANVAFTVGTELGERLLYLPSAGVVALAALLLPVSSLEATWEDAGLLGIVASLVRLVWSAVYGLLAGVLAGIIAVLALVVRVLTRGRWCGGRRVASASSPSPYVGKRTTSTPRGRGGGGRSAASTGETNGDAHGGHAAGTTTLLVAAPLQGVLLLALLAVCAWWTSLRAADWHSEGTLFHHGFLVAPNNVNVLTNLAGHLLAGGGLPDGVVAAEGDVRALLDSAVALAPDMPPALTNLAELEWRAGDVAAAWAWAWKASAASTRSRIPLPCRNPLFVGLGLLAAVELGGGPAAALNTVLVPVMGQRKSGMHLMVEHGTPGTPTLALGQMPWLMTAGGEALEIARYVQVAAAAASAPPPSTTTDDNDGGGSSSSSSSSGGRRPGMDVLSLATYALRSAVGRGCGTPDVLHSLGTSLLQGGAPAEAVEVWLAGISTQGFASNVTYFYAPAAVMEEVDINGGGGSAGYAASIPAVIIDAEVTLRLSLSDTTGGEGGRRSPTLATARRTYDAVQLGSTANMLSLAYEALAAAAPELSAAASPTTPAATSEASSAAVGAPRSTAAATAPGQYLALSKAYSRIAVVAQPADASIATNAGALHTRLGDAEPALRLSKLAASLAPANGIVQSNLGWTCEVFGEDACAGAAYDAALALLPEHPQVVANYANFAARRQRRPL